MIELKHISAGYGKQLVLQELSATFDKGRITGIIGVNGSGKSTLLKTVLSMCPLQKGEITVDGVHTSDLSRNEMAKSVAYLSQGKTTPDMTVEQMVLHGRFPHLHYPRQYSGRDLTIACEAMEQMGIADLRKRPLRTLSGGMRQKAYLAMALAQQTEYILLDEPTTYLDIAHQLELMNILRSLADGGKGIVAVMHDLPMAFTFSDRIILVHEGRIVHNDTPAEVWKAKTVENIFGIRIAKSEDGKTYHYQY